MVNLKGSPTYIVILALAMAALSGCVSDDSGVQKSAGAPSSSPATSPTNSTAPTNTSAPAPTNTTAPTGGNQTGGNQTGGSNASAEPFKAYNFKGKFAQGDEGDGKVQSKTFEVAAGTKQVTAWLTWDDGETGNSPALVDIDLFLRSTKVEASAETLDFEFLRFDKEANFTANPGTWKVEILPYDVPVATDWNLDLFVWGEKPTKAEFKGNKPGVNPGTILVALPGTGNTEHKVTLPADAQGVTARLSWANLAAGGSRSKAATDYDLTAAAGGKSQGSSGNGFGGTEFLFKVGTAAAPLATGEWTFTVASFAVVSSEYTLTIEYI